jgi:hypothetical protein
MSALEGELRSLVVGDVMTDAVKPRFTLSQNKVEGEKCGE